MKPFSLLTETTLMYSFESSNACCILLFSASQKLFFSSPEGIEADFTCIQNFIQMLVWCGTAEPISNQILDTINPIYEALKTLWQLRFPLAEENNVLQPESEQQNYHRKQKDNVEVPCFLQEKDLTTTLELDEIEARQRETPIYQYFPSPIPTHDSSIDKLSFANMHINGVPPAAINHGFVLLADSNLAIILQQIIDLTLYPSNIARRPGSGMIGEPPVILSP
jgi:hypothetical protein